MHESKTAGPDGLSARQRCFVQEYLVDLNATQAAIRAGYAPDSARQQGSRLMAREAVRQAVEAAMAHRAQRTGLTADEVIADLRELRDICMGRRPVKIMTIVKNAREGTAEPIEVEGMMFEPAAANRALEMLGKHMRLFADRMDVTSNGQTLASGVLRVPAPVTETEWVRQGQQNAQATGGKQGDETERGGCDAVGPGDRPLPGDAGQDGQGAGCGQRG